jgi:hypothetical protein
MVSQASTTNPTHMNQQVIKQAINGIAKLLGSNPELLAEQLTGLKALLPGIDESAITRIVEKTKAPRFNPHDLEEEIGNVAAAVQSKSQNTAR